MVPKNISKLLSCAVCLVTLLLSQKYMSARVKNNIRRTEQKFVNKHLLRRGLLSLEINGVLNKLLLLEQCQSQREFAVKVKQHTCPGKLPSHYCVYLT